VKAALAALALACAACGESNPPKAEPEAEAPVEKNKLEKYVQGLQEDVKRAEAAKAKADAANRKAQEAEKLPE
jgi:hypothetical protein